MFKLLYPGVQVKRWLLLGTLGIAVCSIGAAYLLRKLLDLRFPNFLPSYWEGVLLVVAGVAVILLAIYGLYRSIGPLILGSESIEGLADTIYTRRSRGRGPKVVVVGGGTGLSVLLRGLKAYTDNITAIVTVGDDGGSSGRLRQEQGVLPPGDFRNCLVAMSDAESLLTDLFQYRFDQGDGLQGHSFGNLFIVAMSRVTGSFDLALQASSKVLAVHGQIVPATIANLTLSARMRDGTLVSGESSIAQLGGKIEHLSIEPPDAAAYPAAIQAIQDAQLIVIGPGSLYTSILPNLLVWGIARALSESTATKVYVCNVATQPGETDDFTVADHVEALQKHTSPTIADYVLANDAPLLLGPLYLGKPVAIGPRPIRHAILYRADLADGDRPVRHDPAKLARSVMKIYQARRKGVTIAVPAATR